MEWDVYLKPGTRVKLDSGQINGPEYGVVVHCWFNDFLQSYDCYVAFFGNALPEQEPEEKPYILRYASAALNILREQD
jgi:hypothetical protein